MDVIRFPWHQKNERAACFRWESFQISQCDKFFQPFISVHFVRTELSGCWWNVTCFTWNWLAIYTQWFDISNRDEIVAHSAFLKQRLSHFSFVNVFEIKNCVCGELKWSGAHSDEVWCDVMFPETPSREKFLNYLYFPIQLPLINSKLFVWLLVIKKHS